MAQVSVMSDVAWFGFGTIFATILGPIFAVFMTRWVDARRERYRRRLDLFRMLMRSRRNPLSTDFVGGLNLIEVEYYDDDEVLKAWRALLDDLDRSRATTVEDEVKIGQRREYLRAVLLSQMAKTLRFKIPELEIFKGGYNPEGHAQIDAELAINRRFFAEIATGKRAFPVTIQHQTSLPLTTQTPTQGASTS